MNPQALVELARIEHQTRLHEAASQRRRRYAVPTSCAVTTGAVPASAQRAVRPPAETW